MTRLLLKLPWFLAAPLVIVVAGGFAFVAFQFTGDYFRETCENERNLLTGEFEPSNCGEGAKAARAQRTPASPAPPVAGVDAGRTIASGTFRDGDPGHEGKGTVDIQRLADGRFNVFLRDFSVTNGPELWVVLSKSADGSYGDGDLFVEKLKANNGSQNYLVPAGTDASDFRSVIIWCRPFRVTFARASLERAGVSEPGDAGPTVTQAPQVSNPGQAASPTAAPATPATRPPEPSTTPVPAAATTAATASAVPPAPRPTPAPTTGAGVVARGSLRDGAPGHEGSGAVEVQRLANGKLNIFIGNLSVTNGPDLFVVLHRGDDGDYEDGDLVLERLKANNGSQNYALPDGADVSMYRSVSIWCRQFDVTFSYATLEVQ